MNFKLRIALPVLMALLGATAQPVQAEGELMVMPASTRVYSTHEQKVTVKNMGDAPLYLNIGLQKVMNPGMTPEKKVDIGQLDNPGLIASPDKLTLGPSQTRQIVLKSLMEPGQEELYRLYIVPVKSLKVDDAPQDKITAPMSVAIGYGVLVRHLPPPGKLRAGWAHRCENGGITLESTGNVRAVLSEVMYDGAKQPQTIAVFPGAPQHFATKRMTLNVNDQKKTLECSQ
ncbi:pilus assembly protein [Burkholderia sp. Ac-20353]|uniref:pilus assembly protein n=1 Tax=Burkholderia sp. Ac-20353 TaxID=2703894 RepID=UPI00197B7786|nr:pilus assembly protein [Burkholderia sp. Ac-20353]MBN3787644.1 pilus assembly protein [Burkholderia sp. Ac-20353]